MKPKQVNHYVMEFIPYFQLPASGGRKWRHRVGICRWWAITHAHFTKLKPREDGPMANSAHAWYAEKEWEARGLKLWIIAGVNKRARGACRWRCCLQGSDATPGGSIQRWLPGSPLFPFFFFKCVCELDAKTSQMDDVNTFCRHLHKETHFVVSIMQFYQNCGSYFHPFPGDVSDSSCTLHPSPSPATSSHFCVVLLPPCALCIVHH